jgi:hypothetical protein
MDDNGQRPDDRDADIAKDMIEARQAAYELAMARLNAGHLWADPAAEASPEPVEPIEEYEVVEEPPKVAPWQLPAHTEVDDEWGFPDTGTPGPQSRPGRSFWQMR